MQLFNRLETLDFLIRAKKTGTPAQLSEHLGISKRTLHHIIDTMKTLGAPIHYSKYKQTYYYSERGRLQVRFREDTSPVQFGLAD